MKTPFQKRRGFLFLSRHGKVLKFMADQIDNKYYAHTKEGRPPEEWQPLDEHLKNVAEMARSFADNFGAGDLAYWTGLWHDVGKIHPAFQEYLRTSINNPRRRRHGPDHKGVGSLLALKYLEPLAVLIAGHHGGLPNIVDLKTTWLPEKAHMQATPDALKIANEHGLKINPSTKLISPDFIKYSTEPLEFELFIRILFSTLVDADFLDTEAFLNPINTEKRDVKLSLPELWRQFDENQNVLIRKGKSQLNTIRNDIYRQCLAAAEYKPGFFRLTVPTGGGKTRSSMGFGLKHAINYGMNRIIVAIPYTSIIEQTSEVYKNIFDKDSVLEHHSTVNLSDEEDNTDDGTSWARLAAENWNAPVIVTTTVQLFESLFSNKTSRCRKLHNIVNSVIILDEVQTLPTKLLTPILDALRQLVSHYKVSVVFCTATQPALEDSPYLKGINGIREIIPASEKFFSTLKRVNYEVVSKTEKWDWLHVAEEMKKSHQSLTIVNTKKDALALLDALNDPDAYHLSTLLCGAHRRDVLRKIRILLNNKKPCHLVSTQVVEAGVDLDFPLVLRAVGPLDRIVQAAGRCNREGKIATGRMIVFNPMEGGMPGGDYQTGADTAQSLFNMDDFDFHNPLVYEMYFKRIYQAVNTDSENIQALRRSLNYPEVNIRFQMIKDNSISVVVRYHGLEKTNHEVDTLVSSAKYIYELSPRLVFRKLQPYIVNINRFFLDGYKKDGVIIEIVPGLWEWTGNYDNARGLDLGGRNPEDFIV